jgi:hypothetical protein
VIVGMAQLSMKGQTLGWRVASIDYSPIISGWIFLVAVVFTCCVTAEGRAWPRPLAVSISGWVSDSGCGADHTKPGGASCVRKCIAGGASIGHPEWKPQKMVLVDDADRSVWIVDNPAALKGNEGHRVRISGFLNRRRHRLKVVTVESVVE